MLNEVPGRTGVLRRLGVVVATASAGALLLSGCAAGQHAQSIEQSPAIDGVGTTVGNIEIRAAGVLGTTDGKAIPKGGSALLQLIVINTGGADDSLSSVTTPAATSTLVSSVGLPDTASASASAGDTASPTDTGAVVSPSATASTSASASSTGAAATNVPIPLPAGQTVQVGYSVIGANISLEDLTAALYPSQTIAVTFTFKSGASVTQDLSVKLSTDPSLAPTVSDATAPND